MRLIRDSLGNQNSPIRQYVIFCFKKLKKDLKHCWVCGKFMEQPQFHHKKYDDATIYDLIVACQKCNTQPENKFLA